MNLHGIMTMIRFYRVYKAYWNAALKGIFIILI